MSTTNKQTNACFQHREDDREIKSKDAEFWISFTSQSRRFIMGDGQSHSWKYGFILSQVNTAGTKCDQTKSHLQLKLIFFFFLWIQKFCFLLNWRWEWRRGSFHSYQRYKIKPVEKMEQKSVSKCINCLLRIDSKNVIFELGFILFWQPLGANL